MDVTWLFTIPAAGLGFCAGWIAKPEAKAAPDWGRELNETWNRIRDLESRTHSHAPEPAAPAPSPGFHGPDYEAHGHDASGHWRRHVNGTVEHSHDGKF